MKRYIKADTDKPLLSSIHTAWEDIDNGIKFTVYSSDDEVLFEELFDYDDVDPDSIYQSAVDMAELVLSQKYTLSDDVIEELQK